ncbi:MAG: DNA-binding protein [Actinobacteria bacterium]|nr:DNA-binding protein [Actinomycetota bacterium]
MRKATVLLIVIIISFLASPAYALVSSTELIEDSKKYDGKRISFQGEAIGDIMERGEYGWVNVHDGGDAIGVWAPVAELRKIKFAGDYNHIGDTVLVEGIFNQACSEHAGELDIHAESITVVVAGSQVEHPIDRRKAIAAAILLSMAITLLLANRYQKKHFTAAS